MTGKGSVVRGDVAGASEGEEEGAVARAGLAVELAREAGELLKGRWAEFVAAGVEYKGGETNLVTAGDRAAEALIVGRIGELYPEDTVVAEEGGRREGGRSPYRWFVDPLDGTTNFAHGFPWFAVSIAVARGDELVGGAIFNPVSGELFAARRGGGAMLNGRPLTVSTRDRLGTALLATGFGYELRRRQHPDLDYFGRLAARARDIRRLGSAALDLAYVAAGRLDGFWERGLNPWDMAAGILLVEEAGGQVTDYRGGKACLARGEVVATNGRIHGAVLAELWEVGV